VKAEVAQAGWAHVAVVGSLAHLGPRVCWAGCRQAEVDGGGAGWGVGVALCCVGGMTVPPTLLVQPCRSDV
jgi:hypothetical protein